MLRYIFLCLVCYAFTGCSSKVKSITIKEFNLDHDTQIVHKSAESSAYKTPCREPLNYVPDFDFPLEDYLHQVRINVHFMDADSAQFNFSREEGIEYFEALMDNAIMRLRVNEKMNLPIGNDTPVIPANYTYQLTDMDTKTGRSPYAFHYDDEMYWYLSKGKSKNNYKRDVINKYETHKDSVLNIFIQPTHPDSVASPTYNAIIAGIALGTSVKLTGLYELGRPSWEHATNLNHEIAHVLGLSHSWYRNDGCDDTPPNDNCWAATDTPPCSNNMMDYNNSQMALTPCQIGKMHRNFSKAFSKQRKLLVPLWCDYDNSESIVIDEDREWLRCKDLRNDVIIKSGKTLIIHCRVSMPSGSKIIVEPGAKLVLYNALLHNDCGDKWEGIVVQSKGESTGTIEMHGSCRLEDIEKD